MQDTVSETFCHAIVHLQIITEVVHEFLNRKIELKEILIFQQVPLHCSQQASH